jgi:hypothetical protein
MNWMITCIIVHSTPPRPSPTISSELTYLPGSQHTRILHLAIDSVALSQKSDRVEEDSKFLSVHRISADVSRKSQGTLEFSLSCALESAIASSHTVQPDAVPAGRKPSVGAGGGMLTGGLGSCGMPGISLLESFPSSRVIFICTIVASCLGTQRCGSVNGCTMYAADCKDM